MKNDLATVLFVEFLRRLVADLDAAEARIKDLLPTEPRVKTVRKKVVGGIPLAQFNDIWVTPEKNPDLFETIEVQVPVDELEDLNEVIRRVERLIDSVFDSDDDSS